MAQIIEYIKNIGFFLILVSIVCNILPQGSYRKYCRLFCGLVLMLLVIRPINLFYDYNGSFEDIFINNTYNRNRDELLHRLKIQDSLMDGMIIDELENELITCLLPECKKMGYHPVDISIALGHDNSSVYIEKLTLYITPSSFADESVPETETIKISKVKLDSSSENDNSVLYSDNSDVTRLFKSKISEITGLDEVKIFVNCI